MDLHNSTHDVEQHKGFNEHAVLHDLKHYLPAQAPLKDFIHHNTLHAFQNQKFKDAIRNASQMLGYKVSLSLQEFRDFYASGRIKKENLLKVISDKKGSNNTQEWLKKATITDYDTSISPFIGNLRNNWKSQYHINLDSLVHPILFRILCSYLDQGIAIWNFPTQNLSFLEAIKELEANTYSSFFKTERAKSLLYNSELKITDVLHLLVGDEKLYKQYIFDQQFSHQGWSGMVSAIEDLPQTLLDTRKISTKELIILESLLEIDALDAKFGENWAALGHNLKHEPVNLFAPTPATELSEVLSIWQDAYEWSYYNDVLVGLTSPQKETEKITKKNFQAIFCIDDRECSIRRYLEAEDVNCETLGTPGFFGVEFFFQPENGKFYTKLCPAPVTPKYLIKENNAKDTRKKDLHFHKQSHSLVRGWFMTQVLGFSAALKLGVHIFKPTMTEGTASSFKHMDQFSSLSIENKDVNDRENDLQIGFTIEEMATRVEAQLKSIGLISDFAPLIYIVGHGASSINNPHFSAYDCGACSGRPGSVNARVMSFMANHTKVREILKTKGIDIPVTTQFVGSLHDTTRDDISFYDLDKLSSENKIIHEKNQKTFDIALDNNSKERSRRLVSIDSTLSPAKIHEQIRTRSVTLFEPRPELNHATNALCIVGGRELTKNLFLDRRSFMNSYHYKIDLNGDMLVNIMKPLGPVCGGINLEYFFSRVDNQKLGAGTKLPHNVMGLFGVANGIDGDLRPGLPGQMIEVHEPVRLLIIVEHFPEIVLKTIKSVDAMYEWFINEWVNLVAINPETKELSVFKDGAFTSYTPLSKSVSHVANLTPILEKEEDNLPVYLIN